MTLRSHKTVELMVYPNFLLVDGRILILEGSKTYGSGTLGTRPCHIANEYRTLTNVKAIVACYGT
jgi:hypothetical protein